MAIRAARGPKTRRTRAAGASVLHRGRKLAVKGPIKVIIIIIMLCNIELGITANKCLYGGAIAPTALYGVEVWGLRRAEREKTERS